jgi:hypothetical protein
MKPILSVETTSEDKLLGDYVYCVSNLTGLNITKYTMINRLYEAYRLNKRLLQLSTVDENKLNDELNSIEAKYQCFYHYVSVFKANLYSESSPARQYEWLQYHIYELALKAGRKLIDVNWDRLIYTRTKIEVPSLVINKVLNPTTVDCYETQYCFITSLLCDKKYIERMRLNSCYNYKWESHKGNFTKDSLYELLNQPTSAHRKEYVEIAPQLLNKYVYIYPELSKFTKYLKKNPRWWFAWSNTNFKDALNSKELKDVFWFVHCLNSKPCTNIRRVTGNKYKKATPKK